MKIKSDFLFFILFIKIVLNKYEQSFKVVPEYFIKFKINYITVDNKIFLINPNSKFVVLFKYKNPTKNRRLDSEPVTDYFEFFSIPLEKPDEKEPIKFDTNLEIFPDYVYYYNDNEKFFNNFHGYIGINEKSKLFEQIKNQISFSKYFSMEVEKKTNSDYYYKYIFGKEYDENDDLSNIKPEIDDDEELSLSMSHFTLQSIKKLKKKFQYTIEKDNDKYFDLKTKTFISYILNGYHIATDKFINNIINKFNLDVKEISTITYFNQDLRKYKVKCNNDTKNFSIIFDSSSAINLELIKEIEEDNEEEEDCELSFLGYYVGEKNSTDALFLSSSLMNFNVHLDYEDNIVNIEGESDYLTEIDSLVPLVLFFISIFIVAIVIVGVIYIIRKNKINNSIDENNQDNNNSGLVPS